MIVAVAAILCAIFFLVMKKPAFTGAAIPLLVVGAIHFAVGFSVYRSSDRQRTDVSYSQDMAPGKIREEELPRMEKVMKYFVVLRWVEITLAIAGIALFFVFREQKNFWFGLGIALAMEALFSLGADYFAEKRGKEYQEKLSGFVERFKS